MEQNSLINTILSSQIFLLVFTIGIYAAALWLFNRTRFGLLHPILTSAAVIIIFMSLLGIEYDSYADATRIIDFMLGPSVVALGYALYKQREHLKANSISIISAISIGSLVSILSVVGVIRLMGASPTVESSLIPKSVTTPIAISISERLGGVPSLTAFVVIITGIFGAVIAPPLLKRIGVESPIARGLAMGSAAHGIGTARAFEMGALEGAISGLAIGLMGLITALLAPIVDMII